MAQKIATIVCWKWEPIEGLPRTKKHAKYTHEHVNALLFMLRKHISIPFRLLCVTDNPDGISAEVEIVPLWEEFRGLGGCFSRLVCFKKNFNLFGSRFFSIDLDCVIVGDITPILRRKEDFIIWAPENNAKRLSHYCGALWALDAGARPEIYETFDPKTRPPICARNKYVGGSDQWQISVAASDNEHTFTKDDGIYNFVPDIKQGGAGLPVDATIVFFNGRHMPDDAAIQIRHPWVGQHYPLMRDDVQTEEEPPTAHETINIVLFWWGGWPGGSDIGVKYINRLLGEIKEHFPKTVPYRVVLFTDAEELIIPGVVTRKLAVDPALKWNLKKMFLYSPDSELSGPVLCFDLDCIIIDDLSPLVEAMDNLQQPGLLITCQAAYKKGVAGGSIVAFNPHKKLTRLLWDPIVADRGKVEEETKGSERIHFRRQLRREQLLFWENIIPGKILSYKRDCLGGLPKGVCAVRFHGAPRPHEVTDTWVVERMR